MTDTRDGATTALRRRAVRALALLSVIALGTGLTASSASASAGSTRDQTSTASLDLVAGGSASTDVSLGDLAPGVVAERSIEVRNAGTSNLCYTATLTLAATTDEPGQGAQAGAPSPLRLEVIGPDGTVLRSWSGSLTPGDVRRVVRLAPTLLSSTAAPRTFTVRATFRDGSGAGGERTVSATLVLDVVPDASCADQDPGPDPDPVDPGGQGAVATSVSFAGLDPASGSTSLVPRDQPGLGAVRDLSAGRNHSCAVLSSREVGCWGANADGQLGDGTTTARRDPTTVVGVDDAVSVSVGTDHSCALLSSGSVQCWGGNDAGQLGDGTTTARPLPAVVPGVTGAVDVEVGSRYSCAVRSSGEVWCWGSGRDGQLGGGFVAPRATAAPVPGVTGAVSVSAGFRSTCATLSSGSVQCWGYNEQGQLGAPTDGLYPTTPVTVAGVTDAVDTDTAGAHACAVLSSGGVTCWGDGRNGQLGTGAPANAVNLPAPVSGISDAVAVSTGDVHSCAVLSGGGVKCWGYNYYGELGAGTSQGDINEPVRMSGIDRAVLLSAGPVSTLVGSR